ncbi:hypothetical protein I1E95_06890 [Synechococcus sp. CBW1107]|uniref:hypothetical protein n=1 Tax=Synechococcus sp. CBW1107 TaxID=2789857 RepID=UPI0018CE3552|nr:hypothetical protein [Synechococcus sp. CBW1107]QPN57783.1 hypothetical protein I1E95_06890 [Synechococcus sp. CBW1107]
MGRRVREKTMLSRKPQGLLSRKGRLISRGIRLIHASAFRPITRSGDERREVVSALQGDAEHQGPQGRRHHPSPAGTPDGIRLMDHPGQAEMAEKAERPPHGQHRFITAESQMTQRCGEQIGKRKIGGVVVIVQHVAAEGSGIGIDPLEESMSFQSDVVTVTGEHMITALRPDDDVQDGGQDQQDQLEQSVGHQQVSLVCCAPLLDGVSVPIAWPDP